MSNAVGEVAMPASYSWPHGKRAGAVLSVDFDGPSPYLWATRHSASDLLGELEQRRFGPRQGVWRILDMLERLSLRASFYVPGAMAAAYPRAVKAVVTAGHEVALHGFMHERVDDLSADQLADVMRRSAEALTNAGAEGPFGYRSPSWEMTPAAWGALKEAGVAYDSSLMGYDHPYWIDGLVEVPVSWGLDDAIFYRYVAGTARPPVPASVVAADWCDELGAAAGHRALGMITIHPWLSGRAGRLTALEKMLAEAMLDRSVWWATSSEVAAYHREHCPPDPSEMLRPSQP